MKIWKNLFGKNDKIHVDEIAIAPGILLSEGIIEESGINPDGHYIKYGDGTAIYIQKDRVAIPVADVLQHTISRPTPSFTILYYNVLIKSPISEKTTGYTDRELSRVQWFRSGSGIYIHFFHPNGWKSTDTLKFDLMLVGKWK